MSRTQTIIFGLDGADFDMIDPWIQTGALSTLQNLIDRGGRTKLKSCVPATTPPAWTSLTTGMNPGKHGIFGFFSRDKGSYDIEPVSDRDVYARRLWDYTSNGGLTSLVVNVPVTHPGREINGAIVPGYLAQDHPETYPPNLLEDVNMSNYHIYAESESKNRSKDHLLDEWLSLIKLRQDIALRLMNRYDWDLLFLEFQKTDGVVHKFNDRTKTQRIFECVDNCLADIIDTADKINNDLNIFVVSDHGIGKKKDWSVALNTWLTEQDYAKTTVEENTQQVGWLEQATKDDNQEINERNSNTRIARLFAALSAVGLTKQRIERLLSTIGLYDTTASLISQDLANSFQEEVIDRAQSQAFYEGIGFSGVDVGVLINDGQFYSDGVVSDRAEYEDLRSELITALQRLEGPDGLAFRRVQRREEVYTGSQVEYAPDIVLEQASQYVIGSQLPRGKTFIPTESGRIDHKRHGVLIAAGEDIQNEWSISATPSIMDVTPTILASLSIGLNSRFDGKVINPVFDSPHEPETKSYPKFRPEESKTVTDEEEKKLRDRLRGMGYLE
jgi:predicted AlkP superfamily phosphohydrolase/phosphomutase